MRRFEFVKEIRIITAGSNKHGDVTYRVGQVITEDELGKIIVNMTNRDLDVFGGVVREQQ
jgi:hypothetical protein